MTHDEQKPISDLKQANIEINSFASQNTKTNIYFNKNSLEHSIFRFCKKYRFSVRATMSLLSLFSVVVCGVAIACVADFLINNAIFSIVESVGVFGE